MQSRRAARMERHHKRNRLPGLNLVSMMDIFTILVFFLLVNTSDVEVLPNARDIQLPESVAEEKSRENVVVMVTAEHILVQGHVVANTKEALGGRAGAVIPELEQSLRDQSARMLRQAAKDEIQEREVTIMADRSLSYDQLKKIMVSCTAADYGRISLAVVNKPVDSAALLASTGE